MQVVDGALVWDYRFANTAHYQHLLEVTHKALELACERHNWAVPANQYITPEYCIHFAKEREEV